MSDIKIGDIVRIKSTGALREVNKIDRAEVGAREIDTYCLRGVLPWRALDEIELVLRPMTKPPKFVRGDVVECGGEIAEVVNTSGDLVFLWGKPVGVAADACKLLVRRLK